MSKVPLAQCDACGTSFSPEVMIQRGDLTVCAYCELRVSLRRLREAGIGAGELRLYLRSIWQEVWQIDMDDSAFHRNRGPADHPEHWYGAGAGQALEQRKP